MFGIDVDASTVDIQFILLLITSGHILSICSWEHEIEQRRALVIPQNQANRDLHVDLRKQELFHI
jgi:hypothetical protein